MEKEFNIRRYIETAHESEIIFKNFNQEKIDSILSELVNKLKEYNHFFAELAVNETKKGNVQDKTKKNEFVTKDVFENILHKKTVGVIEESDNLQIIADPVGLICALTPMTNPTSTVMFKALIALKTRNPIIFAFHPHAYDCSKAVAEKIAIISQELGAPSGWIQWMPRCGKEEVGILMKKAKLILATGGSAMINAAYSSGTPAIGVGPGNCPSYIHESADVEKAVKDIISSKTFDNGMICASEQSIIADAKIYDEVVETLKKNDCYFANPDEVNKLQQTMFPDSLINPEIVGKTAKEICKMSGFEIDEKYKVVVVQTEWAGDCFPLSKEKLSPIINLYWARNFETALERIKELLNLDGLGHTASIHANDDEAIFNWGISLPVSRLIVNQGTSFGAIGLCNLLTPSLTLGCGSYGNNITTDNISVENLINKKRIIKKS